MKLSDMKWLNVMNFTNRETRQKISVFMYRCTDDSEYANLFVTDMIPLRRIVNFVRNFIDAVDPDVFESDLKFYRLEKPFINNRIFYWSKTLSDIHFAPSIRTQWFCDKLINHLDDEEGWTLMSFDNVSLEDSKNFLDKQKERKIVLDATKCRSCGEFHPYAEPDGIINDSEFTCWACANSPERIRIGLDGEFDLRSIQVKKILKMHKVRF